MFPILRFIHTLYILQLDSIVEFNGKERQIEANIDAFWNPLNSRSRGIYSDIQFCFYGQNLEFAVSECPVVSNGVDEESGQCPGIKTIQNEGERIGDEQSDSSAPDDYIVDEQNDTSTAKTSGLENPFGP